MIGRHTEETLSAIGVLFSTATFSSCAVLLGAAPWLGIVIGLGVTCALAAALALAAHADNPEPPLLKPSERGKK